MDREYEKALELLGAHKPSLVIVQHTSRLALAGEYGALKRSRIVKQGDNSLSFYEPA
jgi:hypothetical protein